MAVDIASNTTAPWSDLATAVLARMRDDIARRARPVGASRTGDLPADDHAVQALLDELAGESCDADGADGATSAPDDPASEAAPMSEAQPAVAAQQPARPRIPARRLLLALRLAATLGSEAGLARLLEPVATTLLDDLAPGEAEAVTKLLDAGFLPAGRIRVDVDDFHCDGHARLVTVRPRETDSVSRYESDRFHNALPRALEVDAPLLILLPASSQLPSGFRQAGCRQLRLAPLDRPILARFLLERFGTDTVAGGEEVLLTALPADAQLRGLNPASVLLALREGTALDAARHLARLVTPQASGLRLRDLVGYGEAREVALGIIEDLAAWQRGNLPWADICHGLLLCGPPGVGKTELARAMARDGGIGFVAASYADWQKEGHLGHFLAAMAASFAEAQRRAPAILFLDELDAFESRSGERVRDNHNRSYDSKAIAGLLQHLDGIVGREGVVVIAACNHPEHIDPAIRRAGRFDRILYIEPPGRKDLATILRQHLGSDLPDADLGRLAAQAEGRTGADCAASVRVARATARQQRRKMMEDDLRVALIGPEPDLTPGRLWRIAIHEAGHAILHAAAGTARPISLSIDGSGGSCRSHRHERAHTADHLRRLRVAHLGGRAAERLILGDIDTGSGGPPESDLAQATRLALAEETSFGLGLLGPLWLTADPDPTLLPHLPAEVQRSIRARLIAEEAEAGRVLAANRALLVEIAHVLERSRFLDGAQLDSLLARVVLLSVEEPEAETTGAVRGGADPAPVSAVRAADRPEGGALTDDKNAAAPEPHAGDAAKRNLLLPSDPTPAG